MRDADELGPHGQNFKAYTYLQVMYMVMFREAFEGALAEMFFWDYAKKFAIKAKGAAGMGPSKCSAVSDSESSVSMSERCLFAEKQDTEQVQAYTRTRLLKEEVHILKKI